LKRSKALRAGAAGRIFPTWEATTADVKASEYGEELLRGALLLLRQLDEEKIMQSQDGILCAARSGAADLCRRPGLSVHGRPGRSTSNLPPGGQLVAPARGHQDTGIALPSTVHTTGDGFHTCR